MKKLLCLLLALLAGAMVLHTAAALPTVAEPYSTCTS